MSRTPVRMMLVTSFKRRNGHVTLLPGDPGRKYKPRLVIGRPPVAADAPYTVAKFDESFRLPGDGEGLSWWLTVLCARCCDGWISLKLHATGAVRLKANFWLGWHPAEQRFAHRGDYAVLARLRPELRDAVGEFLDDACRRYGLTAGTFSRAAKRVNGADQREALPLIGEIELSGHRRVGAVTRFALILKKRASAMPVPTSDPPFSDQNADVSDLI